MLLAAVPAAPPQDRPPPALQHEPRALRRREAEEALPEELAPEPRAADQTERVRAPRERVRHRDGAVVEAPQQEEWKNEERWERGLPRRAVAAA